MTNQEMAQPIYGKKVYDWKNHSVAYFKKNGQIGIRQLRHVSCRNYWWQKSMYERAPKLRDAA